MRRIWKKVSLAILSCVFCTNMVLAQTIITVTSPIEDGFVSDPSIITENNPFTELELKIGKSAVDGTANLTSAIIPFQLPTIPDGEEISDASLKIYVSYGREWIDVAAFVDLYGLKFQSTAAISADDYYSGDFGNGNGNDFGIEDNYFQKNAERGVLDTPRFEETSTTGNQNLVTYLKAQYSAGAVAGDYVFLRLSIDLPEMTGFHYFKVDGGEGTNPAVLSITHQAKVNVAPVLAVIGDQEVQSNESLTVNMSATDDNGDALIFSITQNFPPSAVFTDNGDGTASLVIASAGAVANYPDITVTVSDGELTDSETFAINIIEQIPNRVPELLPIGNQVVDRYGYLKVVLEATDPDNDPLTFSVTNNLPVSASLIDNGDGTAYIELASEINTAVFSDIVVSVSDAELSAQETISITIQERNQNQLLNLDEATAPRFTITDKVWPTNVGEADVSYWNDDKVGVTTVVIDDNIEADQAWWLEMQAKYNDLKFTWFIIDNQVTDWAKYQALTRAGNEVNGHDDCDINDGSDLIYRQALESIQNDITTNTASAGLTYAYPCGEAKKNHVARDVFIGMRGVFGVMNGVDSTNYLELNSRSATNDNNDIDVILDPSKKLFGVSYYRGWYSTHYHAVADRTATENHLNYINANAKDVWIAGFTEAMQYGQERDSHTLKVDQVLDMSVKLTLTDNMKDEVFDFPLTVKVRVNNNWLSASATQNGTTISTQLISFENNKYALIKVVPDRGQVILAGSLEANSAPVLAPIGNQILSEVETLTLNLSASDDDNDPLVFSASSQLPDFVVLTDHQDGSATLVVRPNLGDAGDYSNITISVSDGKDQAQEVISITVSAFTGNAYYCDPVNGSAANDGSESSPWGAFATSLSKPFGDGDVIYLLDGDHGGPFISGKKYTNGLIVKNMDGHQPTFSKLTINGSENWTFDGITIDGSTSGLTKDQWMVRGDASANYITFKNCMIKSADESVTWTIQDWYDNSISGIYMQGSNITMTHNTLLNTYHAVQLNGANSVARYNLIDNFGADGFRALGNFSVFEYNTIRDAYVEDYAVNHDDAFQTFLVTGDLRSEGMVIRFNKILLFEDPITQFVIDNNLIGESMQGIIITDGYSDGWIVENNLLVTDHYHGISLNGAINCRVQNNTVIKHPYYTDTEKIPWILMNLGKGGYPNSNNIIRNNLTADLQPDKIDPSSTVEGNVLIDPSSPDNYLPHFVNYLNYDMRLKAGGAAIDAGINKDLTTYDLDGNARLFNGIVDAGVYEYFTSGTPTIEAIPNQNMEVNQTLTMTISAQDPSGANIVLTAEKLPSFGVLTDYADGTGKMVFSPKVGDDGDYMDIVINANNGTVTVATLFDLVVTPLPNEVPVLDPIGNQTIEEDSEKTVTITASDANGDALTMSATNLPSFVTFTDNGDGTATMVMKPAVGEDGVYNDITVSVTDGIATATEVISIEVTVIPNNPPILAPIEDQSVEVTKEIKVAISATDGDGDALTFSSPNLPSFAILNDNGDGTGELVITPLEGDAGDYKDIKINVSDGKENVSQLFALLVNELVLAVGDELRQKVLLYPNPSYNGEFFIEVPTGFVTNNLTVSVYNISGSVVYRDVVLVATRNNNYQMGNGQSLTNGHYIIKITDGISMVVKHLTVD